MLVYERRIQFYGQKGNVKGRQGVDLLKYGRDDLEHVKEAYKYLKESIEIRKHKTSEPVLVSFVSTTIILYQNKACNNKNNPHNLLIV